MPIRAQEVDWSARAHPIMLRKKPFDLITDASSCPSLSSAAVVEARALAAAVGLAQLVDTGAVVVVRKLVAGLAGPEGVPAAALVKTRLGRLHLVVPVGVVYSPLLALVPNQAILERDLMQVLRFLKGRHTGAVQESGTAVLATSLAGLSSGVAGKGSSNNGDDSGESDHFCGFEVEDKIKLVLRVVG